MLARAALSQAEMLTEPVKQALTKDGDGAWEEDGLDAERAGGTVVVGEGGRGAVVVGGLVGGGVTTTGLGVAACGSSPEKICVASAALVGGRRMGGDTNDGRIRRGAGFEAMTAGPGARVVRG